MRFVDRFSGQRRFDSASWPRQSSWRCRLWDRLSELVAVDSCDRRRQLGLPNRLSQSRQNLSRQLIVMRILAPSGTVASDAVPDMR